MSNLDTANEILAQLGGRRFVMMTGAKNLTGDATSLTFKLPRAGKDGINCVKVTLDPSDTYTVTFSKLGRAPSFKYAVVKEVSDVYSDSLQTLFTATTGLYTSL